MTVLRASLVFVLLLAACPSRTPHPEPKPAPKTAETPAPYPPLTEHTCDDLLRDAHAVVAAHNTCNVDLDCKTSEPACPGGFACGVPVSWKDLAQVNTEVAAISARFEAQCKTCVSKHVRCMPPNPVCREGKCVHEARYAECDKLDKQAQALLQKHNTCTRDDECAFTSGSGGCPMAFACSPVVNKAEEKAFIEAAAPLSRTYFEYCDRCTASVAECQAAAPICENGRCSRRDTNCDILGDLARTLVETHNACTKDADCTFKKVKGRGCLDDFGCGGAYVNKADVEAFSIEANTLEQRFDEQCEDCLSERAAKCGPPQPACVEGRCMARRN